MTTEYTKSSMMYSSSRILNNLPLVFINIYKHWYNFLFICVLEKFKLLLQFLLLRLLCASKILCVNLNCCRCAFLRWANTVQNVNLVVLAKLNRSLKQAACIYFECWLKHNLRIWGGVCTNPVTIFAISKKRFWIKNFEFHCRLTAFLKEKNCL